MLDHVSTKQRSKADKVDAKALDTERAQKHETRKQDELSRKVQRIEADEQLKEKAAIEYAEARQSDSDEQQARYGPEETPQQRPATTSLYKIFEAGKAGDTVGLIVRIHNCRRQSAKLAFFVFREQIHIIQGVLAFEENKISEHMIHWAEHLPRETLVHVRGTLQKPKDAVRDATIENLEILVESLHVIASVEEPIGIDVHDMAKMIYDEDEDEEPQPVVPLKTRMANRIIDLRTPTSQAIFKINSGICNLFRTYLDSQGFIEIHTPKLQPSATESGAEVFKVGYFGRTAFLAQSPQLAKQMCISADFGRVYEIGPVFRAENSNTHRHLTEYTGLDIEMALNKDYHEAMRTLDNTFKSIFRGVYERYGKDIEIIKERYPHDDLVWLEETPVIPFKDGIKILNDSGWEVDGRKQADDEDLSTRAEIRLGQLIKEKYKTDYYILDKFPASARPFYTMPDERDSKFTNSFDVFLRGQEITTGGQRIHDAAFLKKRMAAQGMATDSMTEYMEAFEWAAPPHAGAGVGLERIVMLMLNLGDVRNASLFPRDPKSLPVAHKSHNLPHPEADTLLKAISDNEPPPQKPLEMLIANYGDASNTSWLDDRYTVWRCNRTGAAIGYAADRDFAIIMGNPLCDSIQYPSVIACFLKYLRQQRLRPIWILVGQEVEEILGEKLGWRSLTCVAEERLSVGEAQSVAKKERQAQNAGVQVSEIGVSEPVPEDFKKRVEQKVEEWKANRTGKQVHITEVVPFQDEVHRRYIYGEDKDGNLCGLIIMAQLAPKYGFQVKFALEFPSAPNGTIELLIANALQSMAKSGIETVTFGAGAQSELKVARNLDKVRSKTLEKVYKTITEQLGLVAKSQFREKFGTFNDPLYICYPKLGLGVTGARTLIKFFEDEM
ncbi:putative aspartyl-trna synthetase [Phaeomoniella chlamydospora]|uniref:aspartate--tRNA ligase n=1 Tax=Phaeomoniella chlamydospora TaxID=158046 RepID=A0A0G2E5Z1_PHACM|nr:putative aspartyl-trna synthetase [Phaeomoniella chlamydospora]